MLKKFYVFQRENVSYYCYYVRRMAYILTCYILANFNNTLGINQWPFGRPVTSNDLNNRSPF